MKQNATYRLHEDYMKVAVALAKKGVGRTSPNPAVGAVVVKNRNIIGRGYHKKAGLPHAEVYALQQAGKRAKGADLYITLEPCNHYGRTPPCTDSIIRAGIKKVFVGMKDPNPLVSGKGIQRLKKAGIKVKAGLDEKKCRGINEAYIKYITTKTPLVTLKLASTLDGKIAASSGDSKWITGTASRKHVHKMRSVNDAVMVGIGTVLRDNPELTTRLVKGENPVRIVVDSALRIPMHAKVLDDQRGSVLIATTKMGMSEKVKRLKAKGAEVLVLPVKDNGVDLRELMTELGKREITSVMMEGGARLAASALRQGVVDKVALFYAPKIVGQEGLSMIGELGIKKLTHALNLKNMSCTKLGDDILLTANVRSK